jgi:hypothetical protein
MAFNTQSEELFETRLSFNQEQEAKQDEAYAQRQLNKGLVDKPRCQWVAHREGDPYSIEEGQKTEDYEAQSDHEFQIHV